MNRFVFFAIASIWLIQPLKAEVTPRTFTLREVIDLARKQSPDAMKARHSFQSSYWQYRSYKANFLPSVSLTSSPYLTHSENRITLESGKSKFVMQDQMYVDATLTVNQSIPLTGGSLFVKSKLQRADEFSDNTHSYNSTPVLIGFSQDLFGYNSLKWSMKTEPLYFEKAKKSYVETMELVASQACNYFFNLADALSDLNTAHKNQANADTLYRFAQGRYNIGTIADNELLQLEINKLQSETDVIQAEANVNYYQQQLRSFLGLQEDRELKLVVDSMVPAMQIEEEKVMALTLTNSPDIASLHLNELQSESNVAYQKANNGLKMDVYAQFGLTRTSEDINTSYRDLAQQQYVQLGVSIPLLDWGLGRGKIKVAQSELDLTRVKNEQQKNNIEQNVQRLVWQFNLQANMIRIAAKTAETAQRHHEVTQRLYLLGKSTILDLNAAIAGKDSKQKAYTSAIASYWGLYYTLRSMTLHDFEHDTPLTDEWLILLNKQ